MRNADRPVIRAALASIASTPLGFCGATFIGLLRMLRTVQPVLGYRIGLEEAGHVGANRLQVFSG